MASNYPGVQRIMTYRDSGTGRGRVDRPAGVGALSVGPVDENTGLCGIASASLSSAVANAIAPVRLSTEALEVITVGAIELGNCQTSHVVFAGLLVRAVST